MAAKCNIIGLVVQQLNAVNYGIKCSDVSCAIIENYIEYLNCPDVSNEICNPDDDCTNPIIDFNCNLSLFSIEYAAVEDEDWDVIFSVTSDDYVGATPPLVYLWTFDTDDWDVVGTATTSELKLTLKPGKVLSLLVTPITLQITDSNECTDTKICYLNGGNMACFESFVSCNNAQDLQVVGIYP